MQITHSQLSFLVQEPYYSRGKDYFVSGMIEIIQSNANQVKAKAFGTRLYNVSLMLKGNKLTGECSCPAFEDFGPCKHIAATGLAVIANNSTNSYEPSWRFKQQKSEIEQFTKFLMKKSKNELVDIIIQASYDDPELMYMLGFEEV